MSEFWWLPFPVLIVLAGMLLHWLIRRAEDDDDQWPQC